MEIRKNINKITESFPEYRYDMETTMWEWLIYFWKNEQSFFFELPNHNKIDDVKPIPKSRISKNGEWIVLEDYDIDILIQKTKEIINT